MAPDKSSARYEFEKDEEGPSAEIRYTCGRDTGIDNKTIDRILSNIISVYLGGNLNSIGSSVLVV